MFVFSGKRLRAARGNLPVEALALMLGCSAGAVGHWEAGRRTPSRSTVAQIAEVLDVEPRDLVDEDPMFAKASA